MAYRIRLGQRSRPGTRPRPAPSQTRISRERVERYYRQIAPFYDAELADRGDEAFWQTIASEHRGGRALELGVGSGRVTALLAPSLGEVVGLDLSSEMLDQAHTRLAGCPNVRLLRADMRALPFRHHVDLIVAADDPFSHLLDDQDRAQTLHGVARRLTPGGRLVLDALWLSPAVEATTARPGGCVNTRSIQLDGQSVRVVEAWSSQPGSRRCQARYEYHQPGRAPVIAAFEARAWSPDELARSLDVAGLKLTAVWGSYDRVPWRADTATALIVTATLA